MVRKIKYAAVFIVVYFVVTLFYLVGAFDWPDRYLTDHLYTSYRPSASNIFVIGIDEETLAAYGPWGKWSRDKVTELISYLNQDPQAKPAVIGLDLLFAGEGNAQEDMRFVEAVQDGGNVVLASQVIFNKSHTLDGSLEYGKVSRYEQAFPALRQAAPSGLMNVVPDSDGVVRNGLFSITHEGEQLHSFAGEVYYQYLKNRGITERNAPKLDGEAQWYISFAGKPQEFYGTGGNGTSWIRVMEGEIPRELFADAIVLVGAYSDGMMDSYYTSADRYHLMYGVEIHANAVQALMEGNFKTYLSGYLEIMIVLAVSALLYFIFMRLKLWKCGLLLLATCVLYVLLGVLLFRMGYIITVVYPLVMFVLTYLCSLAVKQLALSSEKARLYDRIERLLHNSITTIINAIDAKDPCTSGHCQRVAKYAMLIGRGMHLSKEDLSDLEYTAMLHDVGKIGVADHILKKEGKLTDEEYAEMKTHPIRGAAILEQIEEFSSRITEGTRYHHERYDGKGYCQGLSGEKIPLFARIISVADTYDAMTQNRPYRGRMTRQQALDEMRRCAGTQFDPEVARIFIDIMEHLPEEEYEVDESKQAGTLPPRGVLR